MWIQELFIDEFDGGGDLTLTQLASALNVVRVPSLSAEACLVEFVPTLLYGPDQLSGPDHPRSPLRGGSLVVTQSLDDSSFVLDLCRLHLGGASGLSDLEVLTERGQETVRQHVLQTLSAIDGHIYRAVFTDRSPPSERLAQWRSADWIVPLLRCEAAPAPVLSATRSQPVISPPDPALHRAKDQCSRIVDRLSSSAGGEPISDAPEGWRPDPGEADEPFAVPADRQQYLQAKVTEARHRAQVSELEQQLARCDRSVRLLDEALALGPRWEELRSLDRQLAEPDEAPMDEQDRLRLRQITRRLRSVRRQLLEATAQPGEAAASPQVKSPDAATLRAACSAARARWARLQKIRDEWPVVEVRPRRVNQLRAERSQSQRIDDLDDAPADAQASDLRAAVIAIRRAAQQRRTARRLAERRRAAGTLSDGAMRDVEPATNGQDTSVDESLHAESLHAADPRIDSLRRQIRQLREETRAMLERQLLSPRVLVGIGLLFSLGLALLGAALTLNLDGAEIATGTIGLICILAAALLKSSFERTPTQLLRQQRLRIADLFGELQQIHATSDLLQHGSPPVKPPESPPAPRGPELSDIRDGDDAERRWQEMLTRWNLPLDCDPRDAVRRLRARAALAPARTAARATRDGHPSPDDRALERDQHQTALHEWTRKAAEALEQPWNADRSLSQWREELVRAQHHCEIERLRLQHLWRAERQRVRRRQRLLREWRRLKDERRRIWATYGATSASEFRQRQGARQDRSALAARRRTLWERFEAALPADDDGRQVRHWLETDRELTSELDEQRRQLLSLQQQLLEAQHAWGVARAELQQYVARRAATTRDRVAPTGDEGADIERWGRVVARTLAAVYLSLPDAPPVESQRPDSLSPSSASHNAIPRLLQLASEGLRHLLSEPALTVGWVDAAQGPYILRGDGTVTSCDDLSRDDSALLVIAVQLSLARCFVERIGQLPLVLTDESLGLPEPKLARLAELLMDAAAGGLQILVVTVDPLVSEQFRQLDVPSLVVTRHEPLAARSAPDRPAVRAAIRRLINEP